MTPKNQDMPSGACTATFAFGTHQVTVSSPIDKILSRIAKSFGAFHVPASFPASQSDSFEVLSVEAGYEIWENGDMIFLSSSSKETYRQLRHAVIRTFRKARPDLLWLHAGAAAVEGRAVVLAGAYGRGKSTIIAGLCQQGWEYLSDDIVPIDLTSGVALPFPLAPNRRLGNGKILPSQDLGRLYRQRIDISPEQITYTPRPIAALIFPRYEHDATAPTLQPYAPGAATLELLRRCLNFKEHQREAVSYLSQLVHRFPSFQLCHHGDPAAAHLIVEAFQNHSLPLEATP